MHDNSAFKEPFVAKLSAQDGDWLLCSHERRVAGGTGRTTWRPDRPTDPGGDRNRIVRLEVSETQMTQPRRTRSRGRSSEALSLTWTVESGSDQRKSQATATCCCITCTVHNCTTSVPVPVYHCTPLSLRLPQAKACTCTAAICDMRLCMQVYTRVQLVEVWNYIQQMGIRCLCWPHCHQNGFA